MHDPNSLNWKRTCMLLWEADDAELQLIIDLITEHAPQAGAVITVPELRAILKRPGA